MDTEKEYSIIRKVSSGTIYKRKDGILVFRQIPGRDHVTVEELEDQRKAFMEIQNGVRSPLIVIVDKLKKLDNGEKMFIASTVPMFADKFCIVTKSPIPTFIFNVFIFLNRPAIPGKVFHSEEEAIKWIKNNG